MQKLLTIVATGALVGGAATAGAQTAPPSSGSTERMTLPKGNALLTADLEINLSDSSEFEPFSIAPDLWYGVTDKITVGLIHSARGETGFVGGVGSSLCLTGTDGGCGEFYDNVGAEARIAVKDGPFSVAVDVGVFARTFDPFTLSGKVGLLAHYRSGKLGVDIAPSLFFGFNEREGDTVAGTTGNKEALALPISVQYAVIPKLSVSIQSGVALPFEDADEQYTIPLAIGGSYAVTPKAFASLAFAFPNLVDGNDEIGAADIRTLILGGGYAF